MNPLGIFSTTNTKLVQLEIGDKKFSIPQNHIWAREGWLSGRQDGVNLWALLPKFQPYTDANKSEFDRPGWNSEITLLLSEHNTPGKPTSATQMTRELIYKRKTTNTSASLHWKVLNETAPYGLMLQRMPDKKSDLELYVARKKNGEFYWIECHPQGVSSPSCSSAFSFSERTYIKYTFSRQFLEDWELIDDGVAKFVQALEAPR